MAYNNSTCDSAVAKTEETTKIGLEYAAVSHLNPGQSHIGQIAL